ncbi:MAG: 16S rRNA (cytosine(967)-C(5))-methyltransferase RsmB [Firmicutes bacterium]|nr:16S rRNA (cytosine(967)-C(5))-methyltransferase RsmB [Bacillota bacterium]
MKDSARHAAYKALIDIERNGAYSNMALNRETRGLEPREQALAREICYEVLKRKYLLDHYLKGLITKGFDKLDLSVLTILRMGAAEILFIYGTPDYASINEAVGLTKRYARGRDGFVNGVLRNLVRNKDGLKEPTGYDALSTLSVRYSVKPWIAELLIKAYGEEGAEDYLRYSLETPELCIRVNLLKNTPEELLKILRDQGFEARPSQLSPRGLIVRGTGVLENEAFGEGRFSVQDEASLSASDMAGAEEGMKVLDLCAAPGGKSCAMAEAMGNRGIVISQDIYEHKLNIIDSYAKRNGIEIIETRQGDSSVPVPEFEEQFDLVVCDVPCTGLGVLRRKPEIKYKDEPDLGALNRLQLEILKRGASYVRKGGTLMYSTCTVTVEENEELVSGFLGEDPGYVIEKDVRLGPETGTDGFYAAKLRRIS